MAEFDIGMTASSAIDELYRIETWNSRASVIATLRETGLFPDSWILERFTDMTEDEVEKLKEEKEKEGPAATGEELGDLGGLGGEEIGGAEALGLPGLESLDKDQARVLAEYKKLLQERDERIIRTKAREYIDTFNYLLNNNEFDGLPLSKTQKDKVIQDDTEKSDPFVLVEATETEETTGEGTETYIIKPLIDEDIEAQQAKKANEEILTRITDKEDASEMQYPVLKISNDMAQ